MWDNAYFSCINLKLGNKASKKVEAQFKNTVEFQNAYARLVKKAMARYKINGLEDTMSDRVILSSLLYHGSVCFFEKEGHVLALPAAPTGNMTLNGEFVGCYVYGRNGFNEQIPLYVQGSDEAKILKKGFSEIATGKEPRGVFVRENPLMYPFINYCICYADKVADCMRTLDVTRANMKRPYIIVAEEQIMNSVKAFFDHRDNNEDVIVSSGVFPADKIQLLPFETTTENIKCTTDLIEWYFNDFDNLCGKNSNASPEKKERMTVEEVNTNNHSTESETMFSIEYLQQQLDFVNECLGTHLSVEERAEEEEVENNDDISGMDQYPGRE